MKKSLLVLLLVLSIAMVQGVANGFDVPRITVDELKAKLGSPDVIVIDVRTQEAYNSGKMKIKGSIRENPSLIGQWSLKYPKDKEIVLYCT
ncbi:MAG: hypothetical protein HQK99_12975 [Nitrospirae bacterium]|nr:hypothetical protein [Nitrospirota bacterium]